jgi:hypothetical protein
VITVPGPSQTPHVRMDVSLSGSTYTILWDWNDRDGAWSFGMDDPSGEPLVAGVRVVLNTDLLRYAPAGDRRPPYPLVVFDPSELGRHPGFEALGRDVLVVYLEPDEEDT